MTRYVGLKALEVIGRLFVLLKRSEAFTIKLERVSGGHPGSGVWNLEVVEG